MYLALIVFIFRRKSQYNHLEQSLFTPFIRSLRASRYPCISVHLTFFLTYAYSSLVILAYTSSFFRTVRLLHNLRLHHTVSHRSLVFDLFLLPVVYTLLIHIHPHAIELVMPRSHLVYTGDTALHGWIPDKSGS